MKSSKFKLTVMLLCLSFVFIFASCKGNEAEDTDNNDVTKAPTATAVPQATQVPTEEPTTAPTEEPTVAPTEAPAPASAAKVSFEDVEKGGLCVSYTFNNTLSDAAGKCVDATMYGNAAFTNDGPNGSGAITFDGTDGTYAELPKGIFDGMDEVTISYDVKSQSTGFFFTLGIGLSEQVYLFNRITTTDMRSAITTNTWSGESGFDYTLGVDGTEWHNYTIVLTPTSMKLYIDGALANSKEDVTIKISDMGTELITYLGKSFYGADPYFNGSIANFNVYKGALSEAEVTALQ